VFLAAFFFSISFRFPSSFSKKHYYISLLADHLKQGHIVFQLQDLKTLRSQLYSAAEYFELAYMQEDKKQAYVSYAYPSLLLPARDHQAKLQAECTCS